MYVVGGGVICAAAYYFYRAYLEHLKVQMEERKLALEEKRKHRCKKMYKCPDYEAIGEPGEDRL